MQSEFGRKLKVTIFGTSHGPSVGVSVDGLPAGEKIDREELRAFLARRSPGGELSSKRREPDEPVFISGLDRDVTTGSTLTALIENKDARPGDYGNSGFANAPRPGHADYTAPLRYGKDTDLRGGGHLSGRLTAPLCVAGGIAKQLLARRGIYAGAHLASAGGARDLPFPLYPSKELFDLVASRRPPVIDEDRGRDIASEIKKAAAEGDSVGGTVECAVTGLPAGLGSPLFCGIENRIASAVFGIPAVKGIEFGSGFAGSALRGSENNDPFSVRDGAVVTDTNNCGGILGGITTGMPVVFRAAFKPTPSISKPQKTVDLSTMTETEISVGGRHDPCVALRAVPAVEAAAAAVILDIILEEKGLGTV